MKCSLNVNEIKQKSKDKVCLGAVTGPRTCNAKADSVIGGGTILCSSNLSRTKVALQQHQTETLLCSQSSYKRLEAIQNGI